MPHELTLDKIMQVAVGFMSSKTLLSAIELGMFTELAKGPQDLESLRTHLDLHPRSARDFFDALVSLGMLQRNNGPYANTPEGDLFLDRAKSSYIGGLLEMANARLYGFWGNLTTALVTGEPQNEAKQGENFFAAIYADPARLKQFLSAMTGLSMGIAKALAGSEGFRAILAWSSAKSSGWVFGLRNVFGSSLLAVALTVPRFFGAGSGCFCTVSGGARFGSGATTGGAGAGATEASSGLDTSNSG